MSRRARQRRKELRSTIRSSRETPRALATGETRSHAYPRIDALLAASAGPAWQAWLENAMRVALGPATQAFRAGVVLGASGVVLGASVALGAGCGTPAQASVPSAPVAVLAPLAAAPTAAKPSEPLATLSPLPPPPPLPETMPAPPTTPTPPPHHPRPHIQVHHLAGVMRPPQFVPTSGGSPAVVY